MDNSKKKKIDEWILCLVIAFVLAIVINKFLLYKVYIPSASMVPTLNKGDNLFVTRVYNPENLERGDIVVFYSDELKEILIKRLIGLPGDKIKIQNGVVNVNGEDLKEDYVVNNDTDYYGTFEVPEDKYFFLGDNRAISKDSRYWVNPYVDKEDIQAEARLKVWPINDFGFVK